MSTSTNDNLDSPCAIRSQEQVDSSFKTHYDVIVVGGGAAGIGAAFGARQAGASVLLIEATGCLGGAMTMRSVVSYCGIYTCASPVRQAVSGVWEAIRCKLLAVEGMYKLPFRHRGVFQAVDPEKVKVVLDEICEEAGIDVLLHTNVVGASRSGSNIHSVKIQQRSGRCTIVGKAFVDASGDGDLSVASGSIVEYGHEGEVQVGSLGTRIGGFSTAARPTSKSWSDAIVHAKKADPDLATLLHKNSSVLIPIPYTQDYVTFLASSHYDARSAASMSRAEREGRKQAQAYISVLRHLPGHENIYLSLTGPDFGTRQCLQPRCQYELTTDDVRVGRDFEDSVALCGWSMEYHNSKDTNWASTFDSIGGPDGVFEVPLRSLLSINVDNLAVAGRLVGADKGASSSVRVMGTSLATGQAAGVYCARLAAGESLQAHAVREELSRQGAMIDRGQLALPIEPLGLPFL